MKISCDIIRDLLPLYAEDMVSQASRDMVDEHLCECDACAKELGKLMKVEKIPLEVNAPAMDKVRRAIRFRRILAVVTVLLLGVTLTLGAELLLDAGIYLTAEQAVKSVEALEDGSIRIQWSDRISITGFSAFTGSEDSDMPTGNYGVIARSRLGSLLFPVDREAHVGLPEDISMTEEEYSARFDNASVIGGAASQNVWYCSAKDGRGETLLWDAGNPAPEEPFKDVNYHLAYYCGGLALLAAVLGGIAYPLRKRDAGKYILYGAVLLASVSVSTVIACAGQFMELWGEFTESFLDGIFLAMPMFATAMCGLKLHTLSRRDKGL